MDSRKDLPGPWACLRKPEGCDCHCHVRSKARHPHNNGRAPWTEEQIRTAQRMRANGDTYVVIAKAVHRTPGAVRQALNQRTDPDNGIGTTWYTRLALVHMLGVTQWALDHAAADGILVRTRYRNFWWRYERSDVEKFIDSEAGKMLDVSKIRDAGFRKRAEVAARINARRA